MPPPFHDDQKCFPSGAQTAPSPVSRSQPDVEAEGDGEPIANSVDPGVLAGDGSDWLGAGMLGRGVVNGTVSVGDGAADDVRGRTIEGWGVMTGDAIDTGDEQPRVTKTNATADTSRITL